MICFVDGVAKDRIVGFEDFGSKDNFDTVMMTRRFVKA
jgi:hypothetical protein